MPSFRNSRDQARHAVKKIADIGTSRHANRDDGRVRSIRTARNYEQVLSGLTAWLQDNLLGSLRDLDRGTALRYLNERSEQVRQPTLDQDPQAIQSMLGERLPRVTSELSSALSGRAYTGDQLSAIAAAQTGRHSLATEIAAACGLRAHELLTIRRIEEQQPSGHRTWRPDIHTGREGRLYVVNGKGGLCRSVLVPSELADRLEARRLTQELIVIDRGIRYESRYDIGGGQAWSSSFGSLASECWAGAPEHMVAVTAMHRPEWTSFKAMATVIQTHSVSPLRKWAIFGRRLPRCICGEIFR